ncbi:MAG: class I SAM-dependent methyltransferase [Myxococcota bacterium]
MATLSRLSSRRLARVALVALLAGSLLALGCGQLKRALYAPDDRDEWQMPDRVIAALAIPPGSRVADIGAGGGYFTFPLADAVGPEGRVYAVDIDTEMLDYIATRAQEEGRSNVETRVAGAQDANLPDASIDLVFTSNTYHHLSDRVAYFRRLRSDLALGGRVAIVEFEETGWFSRWFGHNTDPEIIRQELADAGYTLLAAHDFLPRQSFTLYAPAPAPAP